MKKYLPVYPLLLTFFVLIMIGLATPDGAVFGSEGDWFSQHVALAEQFRQIFYETGRIFPDYSLLGGGSNIYDFSYYGFLRPDVLISFLLPKVPMMYIISTYAVLELVLGSLLCYYWLKRYLSNPFFGFLGAVLFSCAACFYHGHHQIMFVNYMPFLLLALLGIDSLISHGKTRLFTLSLVLVYLHSYYFAPAVLFVCGLYFLYGLQQQKLVWPVSENKTAEATACCKRSLCSAPHMALWRKFISSIVLSIGMTAILLLPTALDILSTQKDAGEPETLQEIFSLNFSMDALLYHPYSCGLTVLCLYTLFLSIRQKGSRFLGIALFLCLTVNICSYLFSGLLYVRYKVLIPFVPLLILLCVQRLEALWLKKETHSLLCALLCLLPLVFSGKLIPSLTKQGIGLSEIWQVMELYFIDIGILFLFILATCFLNRRKQKNVPQKAFLLLHLPLCILPVLLWLQLGQRETYISMEDHRQSVFSQEELNALKLDRNYRFEYLTEPLANANVQPVQGMGRTSMYSSVTSFGYADYFYNVLKNPIRIRNRVALLTDANPVFSCLMGIRYIQAYEAALPAGWQIIAQKGDIVIAEQPDVLPIAYASTSLMAHSDYEELEFPYTLEALSRYTIVPDTKTDKDIAVYQKPNTLEHTKSPSITPIDLSGTSAIDRLKTLLEEAPFLTCTETVNGCELTVSKETVISFPTETFTNAISNNGKNQILILFFNITSPSGDEITIDINRIRNKLSGKTAPYPNRNNTFTYLLPLNAATEELTVTLSPGDYSISGLQCFAADGASLKNNGIIPFTAEPNKGNAILKGSIALEKKSWFVTSYPYRQGYKAYVDGKQTDIHSINEGFVGFPLSEGTHEIVLFFSPPGKNIAAIISLIAWILFFIRKETAVQSTVLQKGENRLADC